MIGLAVLSGLALVLVVVVAIDRGRGSARQLSDSAARGVLGLAALLVVVGALLR